MSRLREARREAALAACAPPVVADVPPVVVSTVVDQLHTGLELFKGNLAGRADSLTVRAVETDTEGPEGIKKKFRNALHLVYGSGEEFFVMVTKVPGKGDANAPDQA